MNATRSALHPELRAIASDAYARAHPPLVRAQQLAEAEELVEYRVCSAQLAEYTATTARSHAAETGSGTSGNPQSTLIAAGGLTGSGMGQMSGVWAFTPTPNATASGSAGLPATGGGGGWRCVGGGVGGTSGLWRGGATSSGERLTSADDAARAMQRLESIKLRWRDRLRNCARDLRAWQPLIELRAMALKPLEQMEVRSYMLDVGLFRRGQ